MSEAGGAGEHPVKALIRRPGRIMCPVISYYGISVDHSMCLIDGMHRTGEMLSPTHNKCIELTALDTMKVTSREGLSINRNVNDDQ